MSLSELCIRRPVMTTLVTVSFVIFGLFAYRQLPVAALPRVDSPTINVTANLPGATPEIMANTIAAPLEREFSTIAGITSMTSVSSSGGTNITLQFDLERDIDNASLDVQAAISATLRQLPPGMPNPPYFSKGNLADQPVLFLSLTSATQPLSVVNDYAEQVLQRQISQIKGVALVQIFGQQKFAIRIAADPAAIAARGLSFADVEEAVSAANSNQPTGLLRGTNRNLTVDAGGQLQSVQDYENLVIASRNGVPVRLRDVATVRESVENDQTAGWYNDERSVTLAIYRQSDANTVDVVDDIKERIESFRSLIPQSIGLYIINDRSLPIREAIHDVQFTLMLSIALVILVIFLFLKTLSATLIPTLALPVSLFGTFAAMYMFGYTIDNISLLALTLSVGFVVDDAIVMLENISRHVENGVPRYQAALRGAREISFTIISITLSLVAVFIPVFFMGGVVGRVFNEFAAVISIAILVSGFVSLTLTPMLCARLLPENHQGRTPGRFAALAERGIGGMFSAYRVTLDYVLRYRFVTLAFTIATVFLSVGLYVIIPKGFFPQEDTGLLRASSEAVPDISFSEMVKRQEMIIAAFRSDPAVEYVSTGMGTNQALSFVKLKPRAERDDMATVIGRLRKSASAIPGIATVFQPVQNINLNSGRGSRAQYQYTLQSADLATLFTEAPRLLEKLRSLPQLRDVNSDLQIGNPQLVVELDRERAGAYGISSEQMRQTLYNAFGTRQISTIYTAAAEYAVILEASRDYQSSPDPLSQLFIRSNTGENVPLSAVANVKYNVGALSVGRQAQQAAVTISFNLAPGIALGQAVDAIRAVEVAVALPSVIKTGFSGAAQLFQDALDGQGLLLLAALLVIYIVLGILYESFIHPITILSGLPSAGLGALLALMVLGFDLSVIAIIGILLLIGIVKKNAIMMIDFAIERRREGADAQQAIREAALLRFRPIMMTTFAALFGTLPIALGAGAGSELRQPLGVAVVGGLFVSQILTLYITPVIYIYLDRIDTWISRRGSMRNGQDLPAEPVVQPPH